MWVEHRNWMQRLADGADLSAEPLPGASIVELAGEHRVLIERHEGMTEYSRERICVKVSFGIICVCGYHLELIKMTKEQLIISGSIDCVQLQRRDNGGCI